MTLHLEKLVNSFHLKCNFFSKTMGDFLTILLLYL